MNKRTFFVSGIGTDVGKSIVSAILVETLQADYWKPIQSGDLDHSDSIKIQKLISNSNSIIHPEQFKLNTPASPHIAAEIDGVSIQLNDFNIPETNNDLIIEGAGGLYVPINNNKTILDLIIDLKLSVILVASYYLGSINHTLLSINTLKDKNIPIKAVIFSGEPTDSTREVIEKMNPDLHYIDIPKINEINKSEIKKIAEKIQI